MVEVLVHPCGPLVGRECSEEGMRVLCAMRFPALLKLPYASLELFPFAREVSLVCDHELFVGRAAARERFLVTIDGPYKRPEDAADQSPRANEAP